MHAIHRFLDRITCDRIIEQSFSTAILQNPDQNALWARQTCKIVWHPHLPAMRSSRRNSAAGVPPRRIVRAQCVKQSTMLYLPLANQRRTTLMISSGRPCSRYARPLARPRVRPPARLPAHSDACTHARTHAGDWRRRAQGDQKRGQAGVELACEREGACMCRYPALVPGRHRCPTVRALPCPLAVCPLAACPLAACARAACPLAACPLAACPLAACPPARCLAG